MREIETERLADVAYRTLGTIRDERRGERCTIASVFRVDVLHDLLAPLMLEIDIDIGRFVALAGNETLEQCRNARGIDFGDAERVADG